MKRLLLAAFAAFAFVTPVLADDEQVIEGNSVRYQITESAQLENDTVTIRFGVTKEGEDPQSVTESINRQLQKADKFIDQYSDVKATTTNFNVSPVYNKNRISHWRGSQSISVTGPHNDTTLSLITSLQAYLNYQGLGFSVSTDKREAAVSKLLTQAIKSYREQAKLIAAAFDAESFKIVETNINTPSQRTHRAEMALMARSDGLSSPVLDAGDSTVSVNISGKILLPH